MFKKLLSLIFIFVYFIGSSSSFVYAAPDFFKGRAERNDEIKKQSELFTGKTDNLDRKDILIMNVSRVIDTKTTKEGDEFFAEVINDVEGKDGIIIPNGTVAHGTIEKLSGSKRLGRDGAIDLSFDYLVTPDGREIPIKGKMSTRLHSAVATSKIVAEDVCYTAAGGAVGGLLGLAWFGLSNAAASQGATIAGGAAIGGSIGLGMALYRKGKDVLISPGDEIRVKINTSQPLPVYKNTAFLQHELYQDGLDVKIKNITFDKDVYDNVCLIKLTVSISNKTNMNFSIFNLALINNKNTIYYPAIFGSEKSAFTEIKSGDEVIGEIPFSVDNVKDRFWLTFYDDKSKKVVAKFSLNNAYKKISNKSKKHNEKFFKKRQDFYTDKLPFYMEK